MFDDQTISISCPGCGKATEKKVRWIRAHGELVCPSCKNTIALEREKLLASLNSAEKGLRNLRNTIRKFGK